MSSIRAFVGAEGLWAKAQKDGIIHLRHFVIKQNEKDYFEFLRHQSVQIGDKIARVEMEKESPDLEIAYLGLMKGLNSKEDVKGMVSLILRFRNVSHIDKAIEIWTKADIRIEDLHRLGIEIHKAVIESKVDSEQTDRYLEQIDVIDDDLLKLENSFSYTLGEASRWARNVLLSALFLLTLLIIGVCIILVLFIIKDINRACPIT
jgi:hypothetical protein